ncbi:uncharacterized protein LOC108116286 [Drosophila eugracilis]|uniref:uncharacterized protein LOC108116286 n=1 Tax=Drosophila eugracilis TaxID=29029 RepID=UPI001BDAF72D|nr:uncharacterized protein LOC108116286 [Drosophila eugracilis]
MSSDEIKLEAAYEQMVEENIKSELEKTGAMAVLRSEMHVKILKIMRGQLEGSKTQPLMGRASSATKLSQDRSLIRLINQLVMEFFHWFGYKHTLETFRMETGETLANRSEIEKSLSITPESKDLPLLAQLIMRDWIKTDKVGAKKVINLPDPVNSKPQKCCKLKKELEVRQTQKDNKPNKLIQNNRKLISNERMRVPITPKKPSPPPRSIQKEESKVIIDSSESDILETDYSEEESEDSDAYKDIPDRQFFIDDLPAEGKYAPGHGEEGPYDAKQNLAESLFRQYEREANSDNIPSSSKIGCGDNASVGDKKEGSKKSNWKSPRRLQVQCKSSSKSDDETVLAVSKPKCPETHIGKIDLESDDSFDDY